MMQNVETEENKEAANELKTIEIEQDNQTPSLPVSENLPEQSLPQTNFGPDMSGSDEGEVSEVDSFILDQDVDEGERGLEASNFLLSDGASLQTVDPETHARLEALLEAAGIGKLSTADGKALTDPEVLRKLTSSVSCALDEAAQALHRMRAEQQGQLGAPEGTRSLAEACSDGDVPTVRKLLHEGGSVHETTEEGESLLSLACSAGYCELAQVLLAMKAGVEDRGIKGDCTPLMEAASGGHVDIVRLLIANSADVNAQSSAGNTPLHYAACGGYEDVVQVLIESGANVEQHNENGHTPLMEAASAGHVCVAQILLNSGAGINTHSNEFKESALTLACYKGHLEMVKFLLEAGADQEHKTDEMHTALMEASMDGHVEVARLLLDSGAQVNMPADSFESPLTLAACGGHVDLASLLIERGANLEEVNDEGYTPLMEAAREGHEEMVSLLLVHGADINAQTEETQETALTLACCGGFLEVADFLIKAGADIELGCSTPLMEAAQEGHLELVKYLLKTGANVHAQTGTGDTALTYACENGHTDVAEVLLQHEAELEHESEGGRTPLMKAARAGHQCTVQFLLTKAGADVNRHTSTNDHTVLSLACAGGHMAVVELLLAHGADPTHKLKDGSTMVIEAAKGGHTQVVKLLLEYPNRVLLNSSPDITQLADPVMDEHRVPVQGLANIVPPSEPDSGPNSLNTFTDIHPCLQNRSNEKELNIPTRPADQVWQNMQKSVAKRTINGNRVEPSKPRAIPDKPVGTGDLNSPCIENGGLPDLIEDTVDIKASDRLEAIINNVMAKELINTTSREEQILKKQHILEELQKVERELQEKAQAQLLLSAQHQLEQQQQQQQIQHALKQGTKPLHKVLQKTLEEQAKRKRDNILVQEYPGDSPNPEINPENQPSNDLDKSVPKVLPLDDTTGAHMSVPNIYDGLLPTQVRQGPGGNIMLEGSLESISAGNTSNSNANKKNCTSHGVTSPQPQNFPLIIDPPPRQVGQQLQNIVIHQQTDQQQQTQTMQFPQLQLSPQQQDKLLQILSQQQQFPQSPVGQQQLQFLSQPPNLQPSVQQQYFTQQQQQQLLQQQHQAQLLQQQLQQQIKPPSTTPPIPKQQLSRKKHQLFNNQVMPPQPANNVLGLETVTVTPPPSTPLTPTPSPASPQSISPLYTAIDLDAQTESSHDTALTLACAGGHAELVTLLLSKEADIEHRDKKGFTPLILAATAGHVDVVGILLEHAADIEAQSERTKDTALSLACSGGRYEVVELLLDRGANKEHRNVSDYTPLSLAASGGYVNIIKLLLTHMAEINSRTGSKLGISPLMLAAMNGHTAAVKLLLDMGSDINAQIETNRNTALTLACFQGRHEVVSLLVDRKANIEHRAKTGLTPLMEAASGGYVEVGRVLLDKGADVNAPPVPSSRDTALTIAADKGHYRFVDLLLLRGAAVDVKNKKGNSPLWLACNGGHLDVVQQLVTAGADIDSQDNRKVSCLMAAFRKGHVKVVKWMVKHVNQFPSDQELSRYIATITDKELQKKCLQCKEILESAKDRQAAEANKNATILLEELDKERQHEENKKAAAAKKRLKKKQKKKEKQQEKKETEKNSSPEPETDNDNEIENENENENENKVNNKTKGKENRDIEWDVPTEPPSATTISTMGTTLPTMTESRNSRSNRMMISRREKDRGSAVIVSSTEAKKNKRNREKEREKENQRVPDSAYISTSSTSGSIATTTTTTVTSSSSSSSHGHHQSGRGTRSSRKRKEGFPIKPVSTTGVSDLDDFGLPDSLKMSDREMEKLRKDSDKGKTNSGEGSENHHPPKISDVNPHTLNLKSFPGMTTSPKRGQKKEDGWKEVVRKSKRVQVPSSAISRVIGRGGCNINAIREVSGAHIEVEKQKGSGERFITIKGSAEATRQAHALITALVTDPDKDLLEILPKARAPEKITQWVPPVEESSTNSTSVSTSTAQKISPKSASQKSGSSGSSHRQSGGSNSSAQPWGSGSPRGTTSPRRSIPKPNFPIGTFTSPPSTQSSTSAESKNITRQLFPGDKKKGNSNLFTSTNTTVTYSQSSPAIKTMTSNVSFSHTPGKNGSVDKPPQMKQVPGMVKVLQRPGTLNQKIEPTSLNHSNPALCTTVNSVNASQPLSASMPLSVSTPGEYMPFDNMFSNVAGFLGRKDDSSEKMNFASVAASGVISSTPGSGNAVGQPVASDDGKVDPALRAKAPGYKPAGHRLNSSQEFDNRAIAYRNMTYQMNDQLERMKTPGYRASIPTSPGISPRSNASTPGGLSPRGFSGLDSSQHSASLSSASSQREEYATPNQPMTLPKIESTLNPNAPDFTSRTNNQMGGSQQMGPGIPPNLMPYAGMPSTSPSMTANLQLLYQQALMMGSVGNQGTPGNPGSGIQGTLNAGSLTQQEFANLIQVVLSQGQPSGSGFPMQQNAPRAYSPLPPQGRPNSAPSMASLPKEGPAAGPVGQPCAKSPLPVNTPPLQDHLKAPVEDRKQPRPIGGERTHRKGPGPIGSGGMGEYGTPFWGLSGGVSDLNMEWVPNTSGVMTSAPIPTSVMTSNVISGSKLATGSPTQSDSRHLNMEPPGNSGNFIDSSEESYNQNPPVMNPMFMNGVPGHYPGPPVYNPGAVGDMVPGMWNSQMKNSVVENSNEEMWTTWSQQPSM